MGKRTSQVGSDTSFRKWSQVNAMMASSLRECWRESELKIICSLGTWNKAPIHKIFNHLWMYYRTPIRKTSIYIPVMHPVPVANAEETSMSSSVTCGFPSVTLPPVIHKNPFVLLGTQLSGTMMTWTWKEPYLDCGIILKHLSMRYQVMPPDTFCVRIRRKIRIRQPLLAGHVQCVC